MRLTNKLCAQHINWHFKKHWQVQGQRVGRDTGAAAELLRLGLQVKRPENVISPIVDRKVLNIIGAYPNSIIEDCTHPHWHEKACYTYRDKNVLPGGLQQAQVLTNTIEITSFPKSIEDAIANQQLPNGVTRRVQNAILASHVHDAEQVKLPKVRLIERPSFNWPRSYGITHERCNRLLLSKLLFEIEKLAGRSVNVRRKTIDNVSFKSAFCKDDDLLEFSMPVNKLITSTRALEPVKGKFDGKLPDLFPMKCTISIPKMHIYNEKSYYPISPEISCSHPHTVFSFFNKNVVSNLHGSEVTDTQFQSRTLLTAFAVAAARAKQLHGNDTCGALPKPIVVQCVQTDGHTFHFGVFQLNTLDLNSDFSVKNYWFHRSSLQLYAECGYKMGRPYLDNYNCEIFGILNAFYHNS